RRPYGLRGCGHGRGKYGLAGALRGPRTFRPAYRRPTTDDRRPKRRLLAIRRWLALPNKESRQECPSDWLPASAAGYHDHADLDYLVVIIQLILQDRLAP